MKKVFLSTIVCLILQIQATNIFVVNSISETLSKIDLETEEVDNNFATLGQSPSCAPNKACFFENKIYVAITYENAVQEIDLDNPENVNYHYFEDSASPSEVQVDDNYMYVTGNDTYKLYRKNLETGMIDELAIGISPESMQMNENKMFVFCTGYNIATQSYDQGQVYEIDLDSFTVSHIYDTHKNPRSGLFYEGELHVFCSGNYTSEQGKIQKYDLTTHTLVDEISVEGTPLMGQLFQNELALVTTAWPASTFSYNVSTFEITTPLDNTDFPHGSYLDLFSEKIAVLDPGNFVNSATVKIASFALPSVIEKTFEVGIGATDIKFDEKYIVENEIIPSITAYQIYPNPSKKRIKIESHERSSGIKKIEIYNIRGQQKNIPMTKNRNYIEADISSLANGIYFVKVLENNGDLNVKKIVKTK